MIRLMFIIGVIGIGLVAGFAGGIYFSAPKQSTRAVANTYSISEISAKSMLVSGWAVVEPWGVWTDGPRAVLRVPLPETVVAQFDVMLQGRVLKRDRQSVKATLNGQPAGSWELPNTEVFVFHLTVPVDVSQRGGMLTITLDIADTRSPQELGQSTDSRHLGVGLTTIRISF